MQGSVEVEKMKRTSTSRVQDNVQSSHEMKMRRVRKRTKMLRRKGFAEFVRATKAEPAK